MLFRSAQGTLTLNKAGTSLVQKSANAKPSTVVNLSAKLTRATDGKGVANRTINFYVADKKVGSVNTDSSGFALFAYVAPDKTGTYALRVTFGGDDSYLESSYKSATLTVK